uniref:Uncharacterized protein n=1 Tax=Romanomermis culicivorax TaxID=13658 RepID=A0A915JXN8_ROMCU
MNGAKDKELSDLLDFSAMVAVDSDVSGGGMHGNSNGVESDDEDPTQDSSVGQSVLGNDRSFSWSKNPNFRAF